MPLRLSTALYGKSSKQEEASQRTRRRLSSYISRSKMLGLTGAEASSGPPPWASLPSSLATVFLLQRAEEGKRKRKQCRTEATYTELLTFPLHRPRQFPKRHLHRRRLFRRSHLP